MCRIGPGAPARAPRPTRASAAVAAARIATTVAKLEGNDSEDY